MKFSDTKNDKDEMDDMDIKTHLNTSLDLSGVSVSEDLINRTLEAIRQNTIDQPKSQVDAKENTKKIILWNRYARGFAGVAAAVLIVVVGYSAVKQMSFHNKENSITSEKKDEANYERMENSADENINFAASSQETTMQDDASSSDILAVEPMNEAEMEPNESMTLTKNGEAALLTFRDIFLPTPEQAQYITITDEINGTSISLTDQAEIKDFYSVMDNHQFTYGVETSTDQKYTVEVKSPQPEEAFYTLIVGSNLMVRFVVGDSVSESIYLAVDDVLFQKSLEDFYQDHRE